MQLYYVPRTRAGRPRWLLEELGVPYELRRVDVAHKQNKTPEYLALHPQGHVPVLVDDGVPIFESTAICLYLADKFADRNLAPPVGSPARGHYYQWIVFAMTELESNVASYGMHTATLPVEERVPALAERARAKFAAGLRVVEDHLADRSFLLGVEFTAADVVLGAVLVWARSMKLLGGHPVTEEYVEALVSRPAYQRSRAD